MRLVVGVMTALALCGTGTGCGGGSKSPGEDDSQPLSKRDFIEQATRICRSANNQGKKLRKPNSFDEADRYLSSGLVIVRREVGQLSSLQPPSEFLSRWQSYLHLQQRVIESAQKAVHELRAGHRRAFTASLKATNELDGRAGDIIYALGIHSCALLVRLEPPDRPAPRSLRPTPPRFESGKRAGKRTEIF